MVFTQVIYTVAYSVYYTDSQGDHKGASLHWTVGPATPSHCRGDLCSHPETSKHKKQDEAPMIQQTQVIRWQETEQPTEQLLRQRMQAQRLSPHAWSNGPGDYYAV